MLTEQMLPRRLATVKDGLVKLGSVTNEIFLYKILVVYNENKIYKTVDIPDMDKCVQQMLPEQMSL